MSLNIIDSAGPPESSAGSPPSLVFAGAYAEGANNIDISPAWTIENGDLAIIAFTSADGDGSWSFDGDVTFTPLFDDSNESSAASYVGYAVLDGTEATISTTGAGGFEAVTVVVAVFRGAGTPVFKASANGTGDIDPPSGSGFTPDTSLVLCTGHQESANAFSAPSGYTLADEETQIDVPYSSGTAIAYKTAASSTENPGAFTSGASPPFRATTIEIPISS